MTAAHDPRLLGGELAGHALPAAHGRLRHDQGAAGLAGHQLPPERGSQSRRRLPGTDDDGGLSGRPARLRPPGPVRLRRSRRRLDRRRGLGGRLAPDCPNPPVRVEAIGGSPGLGGWFHRPDYPRMASWTRPPKCGAGPISAGDVDVAELYDGFTFLTFAWLEALGLCGEGSPGPSSRAATGSPSTAAAAEHLRRAVVGRAHARLLGPARGVPATSRQAGDRQVPGAEVAVVSARRRPDRRVHAPDIVMPWRRALAAGGLRGRYGGLQPGDLVLGQLDERGVDVLVQVGQLRRTGDRQHGVRVGQRPSKCHLLAGDTSFIRNLLGGDGCGRGSLGDRQRRFRAAARPGRPRTSMWSRWTRDCAGARRLTPWRT